MDELLHVLLALAALVVPLLLAWFICARQLGTRRPPPSRKREP